MIPAMMSPVERCIRVPTIKLNEEVTYDVGSNNVTQGEIFVFMCCTSSVTNSSKYGCGLINTLSYTDCWLKTI